MNRRTRRYYVLALLLGLGVAAALAVYSQLVGGGESAAPATLPNYTSEQIALGELYYGVNCATCHGADGAGDARAGVPALDGSMHAWHHPDGQIASIIRQGGLNMPAVGPEWTDGEITAVLAYVKEWWTQEQRAEQARSSDAFR